MVALYVSVSDDIRQGAGIAYHLVEAFCMPTALPLSPNNGLPLPQQCETEDEQEP